MPMPHWNRRRLEEHFAKHPGGQCAKCWAAALNTNPVAITDYESASLAVIADNWLAFKGKCLTDRGSTFDEYCYYVGFELLITILLNVEDRVTTSYRFHKFEGRHDDLRVDTNARLDVLERFISWKDSRRLKDIEQISFTPKTKSDHAAYAQLNLGRLALLKFDELKMRQRARS